MELIVKIPDEAYELLKSKPALDNIAESIIANGTPYNPSGDAISREAVRAKIWKERVENDEGCNSDYIRGLKTAIGFIDSAMSMNYTFLPQYQADLQCAYDCGYEKGKQDRPKGEWKLHGMIYYCSNCGHDCGESGDNFCGNCGADMRKGSAE